MASGWAPDGAVQDQIDDTVTDGVMRARARMPTGAAETHCLNAARKSPKRAAGCLPEYGLASSASRRVTAVP
jgi:hypothetical protein